MTGNGKHTPDKNGNEWGMVYDCFTYMILEFIWHLSIKTRTIIEKYKIYKVIVI